MKTSWCGSWIPEAYSAPRVEAAASAPSNSPTLRASQRSATGRSPNAHGRGEGMSVLAAAIRRAPTRIAPSARTEFPSESVRPGSAILLTGERQECQDPRALHGFGDLRLVAGARAGDPPRHDLPAVGDESREPPVVLVIDALHLVEAELAELSAKRSRFAFAGHQTFSSMVGETACTAPAAAGSAAPGSSTRGDSFTASTVRCLRTLSFRRNRRSISPISSGGLLCLM